MEADVQKILMAIKDRGSLEYCDMSVEEARKTHESQSGLLGADYVELPSVSDITIPGRHGDIPARLYKPVKDINACLIYYHGGGHVVGSLNSYDTLCRQLALQSNCMVASIDYRLAPEHRFPVAVEDALDAYFWFCGCGHELGISNDALILGGDSAGGNLAAVVAIMARDLGYPKALGQLLIYPATAGYPDSASHLKFAEDHVLTRRLILWFQEKYLDRKDHIDFRWAPLLCDDLSMLPPATIILAECDPLRDEGLSYAVRLAESGNELTLKIYSGVTHPFFSWSGAVKKAREAVSFAAAQLTKLAPGN